MQQDDPWQIQSIIEAQTAVQQGSNRNYTGPAARNPLQQEQGMYMPRKTSHVLLRRLREIKTLQKTRTHPLNRTSLQLASAQALLNPCKTACFKPRNLGYVHEILQDYTIK